MPEFITVFLIDTNASFKNNFSANLNENNIKIIGYTTHDDVDLRNSVEAQKADIIICSVDDRPFGDDAFDMIKKILEILPKKRLVAMTYKFSSTAVPLIQCSEAKGYFYRAVGLPSIVNCIREVYKGRKFFSYPQKRHKNQS